MLAILEEEPSKELTRHAIFPPDNLPIDPDEVTTPYDFLKLFISDDFVMEVVRARYMLESKITPHIQHRWTFLLSFFLIVIYMLNIQ